MIRLIVRARFRRGHRSARPAIESVIKEERRDTQLGGLKLIEDVMCVITAVVVPYSSMVPAYYEMRAAIVLPHEGMKDRLTRPRITHCGRQYCKDRTLCGIVMCQDLFVRSNPDFSRHIVRFGFTNQRVQQQTVGDLEGTLLDVFVGAVDRIASLKRDYSSPAMLLKQCTRLGRIYSIPLKLKIQRPVDQANISSE